MIMMLQANNIAKTYPNGTIALTNVNLTVEKGEILGIVGINGAGKTTLLKIAVGVLLKDKGDIRVCEYEPIISQDNLSKKIGWIPQDGGRKFSSWLSGRDNILYYNMVKGLSKSYILNRLEHLAVKICPERKFLDKNISLMSGGQIQLVNILNGLIPESEMLFCDEISVSIDPIITERIYDYLREYVADGRSVLLTSQNIPEIESLSNRVALLHKGKIIEIDTPRSLSRKILEYETIDMKFEVELDTISSYKELISKLQNIKNVRLAEINSKNLRLKCTSAYDILSEIVSIMKTYDLKPLLEVGKPNLQDAMKFIELEENK